MLSGEEGETQCNAHLGVVKLNENAILGNVQVAVQPITYFSRQLRIDASRQISNGMKIAECCRKRIVAPKHDGITLVEHHHDIRLWLA